MSGHHYFKILILLYLGLFFVNDSKGHGYIFSETNEEMKDDIEIYLQSDQITIKYESVYLGQIAPHIRNMIDRNIDSALVADEVNHFFDKYKNLLNSSLHKLPFLIGKRTAKLNLINTSTPTICADSLLAPFKIEMTFKATQIQIAPGEQELIIDPKLFFLSGNQFIDMAKEMVEFTEEQEKSIGRFLQIKIIAADAIQFLSTYPGYIKKDKRNIFIYGVFYDETILRIRSLKYPKLRIKFKTL